MKISQVRIRGGTLISSMYLLGSVRVVRLASLNLRRNSSCVIKTSELILQYEYCCYHNLASVLYVRMCKNVYKSEHTLSQLITIPPYAMMV